MVAGNVAVVKSEIKLSDNMALSSSGLGREALNLVTQIQILQVSP